MLRFYSVAFIALVSAVNAHAEEIIDYLNGYTGRWVGDFTIYSGATGYSETFPVEQRYWWVDQELHGISVAETNDGMQVANSRVVYEDGQLITEVVRGDETEIFLGVLHDDGLVWLPEDLGRATDYQMKESFVELEGERWLHTDGFDTFVYQEGLAHIVYRGRLKQISDEAQ